MIKTKIEELVEMIFSLFLQRYDMFQAIVPKGREKDLNLLVRLVKSLLVQSDRHQLVEFPNQSLKLHPSPDVY